MHGEMRKAQKILDQKPEDVRPLGMPLHRWDDISVDCKQIGYKLDSTPIEWGAVVGCC
jgi:hypothetical protein